MPQPRAHVIIPARLASSRLPRKVILDETGLPLVVHVCRRAAEAEGIDSVTVAADSEEIVEAVRNHGFEAVMTSRTHPNGTSRLAEVAQKLGLSKRDIVVNVQGDEPEIEPELVSAARFALGCALRTRSPLGDPLFPACATVASPFGLAEDPSDPNIVKVVTGLIEPDSGVSEALYFSRAPIPADPDATSPRRLKHLGIYAYALGDLLGYVKLPTSPLEHAERLEQLRWLEHGLPIAVAIRNADHAGIDTPADYEAFVRRWRARNA
ncbi:MAG: 3-deoxy-manno-octulosonate cytidylyltransferase [Planctomycetota bacterium]